MGRGTSDQELVLRKGQRLKPNSGEGREAFEVRSISPMGARAGVFGRDHLGPKMIEFAKLTSDYTETFAGEGDPLDLGPREGDPLPVEEVDEQPREPKVSAPTEPQLNHLRDLCTRTGHKMPRGLSAAETSALIDELRSKPAQLSLGDSEPAAA